MSTKRQGGDSATEGEVGPTASKRQETDEVVEVGEDSDDFVHYNIDEWVEENQEFFLPPVCNKLMHQDGQMKVFFVGGPNERRDYHIEEGEELFFMMKGDMCLKVVEKGQHRDVDIKEGQLFLLPARIPHSPQRKAGTVGMVIERDRADEEQDGLRYFVEKDGKLTTDILYERWFHCEDLGPQLAAIIKDFFNTEQSKTGKPIKGTISDSPPLTVDVETSVKDPIYLKDWLKENRDKLKEEGGVRPFGAGFQFEVQVFGGTEFSGQQEAVEVFIWQLEGTCDLTIEENDPLCLEENDSVLVKAGSCYSGCNLEDSVTLVCYQDPARATT